MPRNFISSLTGELKMATRNYRQAKRSREETRKKRQQEKLLRKANRGAAGEPVSLPNAEPDAVAVAAADKVAS
jgi:hypothetical protein